MSRVSGKPYFVYILWSTGRRRFYIGVSENPEKRLEQHNHQPRGWTSRFRPWVLVLTEPYANYRQARTRELQLKSQKSGLGFFRLTGLNQAEFRTSS